MPTRRSGARTRVSSEPALEQEPWLLEGPLGKPGKEGTVSLARDARGGAVAVKQFRRTKSATRLLQEYAFLERAGAVGAAPRAVAVDQGRRTLAMQVRRKLEGRQCFRQDWRPHCPPASL